MIEDMFGVKQGSDDWHELRRTRVTASEAYDALHYPDRAIKAHVQKRLGIKTFTGNAATEYGHEAEPVAIEDFEARFNCVVSRIGFVTAGGDLADLIGCSPDGIFKDEETGESVILQVKCPHTRDIPNKPDQRYIEQVNYEMGVTGISRAVLWYWTPGAAVDFDFDLDEELWKQQVAAAEHVQNEWRKIEYIGAEKWLQSQEKPVTERSDDSWAEACAAYFDARVAFEAAEQAFSEAKKELQFLSDNLDTQGCGVKVSWLERSGTVNWPKIAKKYGIPKEEIESYRSPPTRYAKVEVQRDDKRVD